MLDIKNISGIVAILLTLVGYIPYIKDTIKGKTTPHAYTWFTFGLVTAFVFALQLRAGAGIGAFVTLVISISVFAIFFLSLFKGEKHITRFDKVFFVLALVALAFWVIVKQPIVSVVLLSAINILAFSPTIRKSWNNPFSETLSTYVVNASRYLLALLALEHYSIVTYLFPLSAMIVTFSFVVILVSRRKIVKI
ncbi:MAG: hypothetical protein WCI76_00980 [bacterium]